jgi:hypothetical protein
MYAALVFHLVNLVLHKRTDSDTAIVMVHFSLKTEATYTLDLINNCPIQAAHGDPSHRKGCLPKTRCNLETLEEIGSPTLSKGEDSQSRPREGKGCEQNEARI